MTNEINFEIKDNKIIKDSSRVKPDGIPPLMGDMVAPYLETFGVYDINGWTNSSKSDYEYTSQADLITTSDWDSDNGEWTFASKDSIIYEDGKIAVSFSSEYYSVVDTWDFYKYVYSYNDGNIEQIVSMYYENDEWINAYRTYISIIHQTSR